MFKQIGSLSRIVPKNVTFPVNLSTLGPFKRDIFQKFNLRNFSLVETLKLQNRIKVEINLTTSEISTNPEHYKEKITLCLEKENYKGITELIKSLSEKQIALDTTDVNKIFGASYKTNRDLLEQTYEYILDTKIRLNSLSFYYLIMSALKYKGFNSAYNLFVEANLFNIPLNLTVCLTTLEHIAKEEDKEKRQEVRDFVFNHIHKHYQENDIE